ncbi:hypothetical protein [Photorhabdus bodei]|uniref:Uncharacterized protein n=1 Tax=Photorhabdus bodei TaxID=2029681 RepID=A0ABX0ASV7_9GAMM|nr:hypothetical protein [Photorhabdus bodei]NDK99574.1 hypothetical protein [Photorhabdus bodei]NDL03902.1 hypothetical protein [Photorhabdus bodei]NDL07953.1 hypothetical protein [Photorhabdus bodei]
MNKKISAIFIALSLFSAPSFSGQYTISGYVQWLKANSDKHCWGYLNSIGYGQGFYLDDCNQEMMHLLRTAQIIGTKVDIYPMDFKMHRGGKGANPREHRELCDRGE